MRLRIHKPLRARRSGVMTLELVLVLPIVALILFAVVEFSLLFSARQSLVAASRSGARIGSLSGATAEDVERAVREQLDPCVCADLAVDVDLGRCSGDPVIVSLRVPMCSVSPDLLKCIGFSVHDNELVAETVMCKE